MDLKPVCVCCLAQIRESGPDLSRHGLLTWQTHVLEAR